VSFLWVLWSKFTWESWANLLLLLPCYLTIYNGPTLWQLYAAFTNAINKAWPLRKGNGKRNWQYLHLVENYRLLTFPTLANAQYMETKSNLAGASKIRLSLARRQASCRCKRPWDNSGLVSGLGCSSINKQMPRIVLGNPRVILCRSNLTHRVGSEFRATEYYPMSLRVWPRIELSVTHNFFQGVYIYMSFYTDIFLRYTIAFHLSVANFFITRINIEIICTQKKFIEKWQYIHDKLVRFLHRFECIWMLKILCCLDQQMQARSQK